MLSRTLSRCQYSSLSIKQYRSCRHSVNRSFSDKSIKDPNEDVFHESKVKEMLKGAANFNESMDSTWATTPYPEGAPSSAEEDQVKTKHDPAMFSVLMFPGQGTLKVGMVKDYLKFPRVKELYENANAALGYDLLKLSLSGPQERLDRTEFNQPATVAASLAALERLWEERPRAVEFCRAVAGYSVGEISALIFSGAISIEDGIRLAAVRGAAMQAASENTPQGMISVFCSASAKVSKVCEAATNWAMELGAANPVCRVAIYQFPQGKVLAGSEEALQYIENHAQSLGLRHLKRIPVSGAFHTPLMESAVKPFTKALQSIELEDPRIDVYSNVNGKSYRSIRNIKKLLPKQIVSPVKWEQVMHTIFERPPGTAFPRTFDLGSGGTMKILLKKINAKAWESCYEL